MGIKGKKKGRQTIREERNELQEEEETACRVPITSKGRTSSGRVQEQKRE